MKNEDSNEEYEERYRDEDRDNNDNEYLEEGYELD